MTGIVQFEPMGKARESLVKIDADNVGNDWLSR